MKKILLLLYLIPILFVSCSKQDLNSNNILGDWRYVKSQTYEGDKLTDEWVGAGASVFSFYNDGTAIEIHYEGEEPKGEIQSSMTWYYELEGDTLILDGWFRQTLKIELTNSTLVLKSVNGLHKHYKKM